MARANHETRLQIRVVDQLRSILPKGSVVWSVPNGGKMSAGARKRQAAMGELPGASDLMFITPTPMHAGRLHCIELKVRKDPLWGIKRTTNQEPAQEEFQRAIEEAGGRYAVARHTDDVKEILASWGIPTREKLPKGKAS